MESGPTSSSFEDYVRPIALLSFALLLVWMDDGLLWSALLLGLTIAHLMGDNVFSRRKSSAGVSVPVVLCDLGIANGAASMLSLFLVFVGVPSRASNYDEGLWVYAFGAAVFSVPVAVVALVVRIALQSKVEK